jgi:hypothetical protein
MMVATDLSEVLNDDETAVDGGGPFKPPGESNVLSEIEHVHETWQAGSFCFPHPSGIRSGRRSFDLTQTALDREESVYCALQMHVSDEKDQSLRSIPVLAVDKSRRVLAESNTDRDGIARLCDLPPAVVDVVIGRDICGSVTIAGARRLESPDNHTRHKLKQQHSHFRGLLSSTVRIVVLTSRVTGAQAREHFSRASSADWGREWAGPGTGERSSAPFETWTMMVGVQSGSETPMANWAAVQ